MGEKMKISKLKSKHFTGYKWPRSTNISPGESIDVKESVRNLTICPILCHFFYVSKLKRNYKMLRLLSVR
jgi:hypothetical protein